MLIVKLTFYVSQRLVRIAHEYNFQHLKKKKTGKSLFSINQTESLDTFSFINLKPYRAFERVNGYIKINL